MSRRASSRRGSKASTSTLVLTSPRRRARETCEFAGLEAHAEVTDDLCEWDYGEYEGRTTAQIREDVPGLDDLRERRAGGRDRRPRWRARRSSDRRAALTTGGRSRCSRTATSSAVLGARWIDLDATDGRLLGLDTATISVLGHERTQRVLRVWNAGSGYAQGAWRR